MLVAVSSRLPPHRVGAARSRPPAAKPQRVDKLATPTELRGFWRCPFNEPLCCVSFGRLRASPTMAVQDQEHIPLNVVHPLRQPVRAASSPIGGAKAAAPQREATSLPYNGRCKIARTYHSTQYTPGAALKRGCLPRETAPILPNFENAGCFQDNQHNHHSQQPAGNPQDNIHLLDGYGKLPV